MVYFLKKSYPSSKGLYLQIYINYYDSNTKSKRNKCYKSLGYECDLIDNGIANPVEFYKNEIIKMNEDLKVLNEIKIGDSSASKNIGYFLLKSMFDYLDMDYIAKLMSSNKKFQFKLIDFIKSMVYAQVVNPGSKHNAFENVMPNIYGIKTFSYDQILDTINYIGNDYEKFIELLNLHIDKKWKRSTSRTYFDCTNYYFEIDLPCDDKQFGPSKENRHCPIIGQALLLDEDQIPLAMKLYPGNKSEIPYIRNTINEIKERYEIESKIVQVADKGLNCARNIYAASIEANDGYIFSKSIHGSNLSSSEKEWLLLDNSENVWIDVLDKNNKLLYRYKECIDVFEYSFTDSNGQNIKFSVKEKRIVTYNPTLARKQKIAIQKEIDKAKNISSLKQANKDDFGDSIKYVKFIIPSSKGKSIKPIPILNTKKINDDLKYAGYNLLVTSEIDKSAKDIYKTYHCLWRIEESFRIMKTYLEARPVYLQNKESIYGHFTICYFALTILRLLEFKVFNDDLPISHIINFIRNFNITETFDGSFINNASKSSIILKVKDIYGLSKLDVLHLKLKDINNILNVSLDNVL